MPTYLYEDVGSIRFYVLLSFFFFFLPGPDKVLLVSSTQTVVEFTPSAGSTTMCNMEIKVGRVKYNICNHINSKFP